MIDTRGHGRAFREVPIRELMAEFHDGPHATPKPANAGPVFLGITNITEDGRLDLSTIRYISEAEYPRWTRRVVPQEGDVVFTYEATLHRYALIPRGFRGCLGRRLALIRPRLDLVDPKFLHLALRGPDWRRTVEERVIAGATVDRVPLIDFPEFPIRIPSLEIQRRIVAVLGSFDELIDINEQRIALFEQLAQSLYREWFVRYRFPGHERDEALNGSLPAGWRSRQLGDVVAVNARTARPAELPDPLRYVDISTVGIRRIGDPAVMSAESAPGRARRRVLDGDTLWATVRPNRRAHALVHNPPDDLIVSTGLAVLTPTGVPSSFLFEYSSSPEFTGYLASRATGSAYPAVRPVDFEQAPIVVAPDDLMDRFDAVVDPLLRAASALETLNRSLARVRDLLLPRMVVGNLDISDVDVRTLLSSVDE